MMEQVLKKEKQIQAKPIMKWAGGKTQMLGNIMPKIPQKYGKYIEPFIGGGALFFALSPDKAIIADSNPELINMYRQVADNVETVISYLKKYKNTKEDFYEVRSLDWLKLKKEEAAARTIYLNKTCFNGLYRVNKKGQFNVPFGKYKAPNFCDEEALYAASDVLKKATITCGDYLSVLKEYAEPGDFIFLDPPYLPISEYSDFKRYTKEQFYEEDHVELAKEVKRLQELGCHVILTNSNHPLVHELYADYKIEVIQTKRYISCNGSKRKGEDIIVDILPKQKTMLKYVFMYVLMSTGYALSFIYGDLIIGFINMKLNLLCFFSLLCAVHRLKIFCRFDRIDSLPEGSLIVGDKRCIRLRNVFLILSRLETERTSSAAPLTFLS